MKKLLLLFTLFSVVNNVNCQEIPTSLIDRINHVKYIFEGKVLESKSYQSNNGKFIRTSHLVQITKILKGNLKCGTIEIITNGGELNDEQLSISHSLELSPGSMGIFLCNNTSRPLSPIDFYTETNIEKLEGTFENQSFIHYWWDGQKINAADVWQNYDSLAQVYNITELITGLNFIDCGDKIENSKSVINIPNNQEEFPTYSKEDFDELINYADFKRENYTRVNSTKVNDEIFYDLKNLTITGTSQKYLEFDVTVKDNLGTKYLDQSAVRIEYDPTAFGNNVVANSNIIVTRGTLNADPNCYSSPIPSDANSNTILIPALETVYSQCKAPILQTAQSIMHIKMKIQTCNIPNDVALVDTATFFGPSLIINYSAYAEFPADTFQTYYQELEHNKIDSVPACIAFWPKKLAGGIGDTLTIKGNSFGANKGFALFQDADNGGISQILIEDHEISLWTDSLIKIVIPSYANSYQTASLNGRPAGTGQFMIHSESGSLIIMDTIKIHYSIMNHEDKKPYVIAPRIGMNKKFIFHCDTAVANYDNGQMKQVINKALNDWKCLTGVDWELGSDIVYLDSIALSDSVCTITFYNYPDTSTTLALTSSKHSRIIAGTDTTYQTIENDITINSDHSWFCDTIITNSVPIGQQDFYAVILHELGHAHGLKHVIDLNAVMHYSSNQVLRITDLNNDSSCDDGGNWVADYTNDLSNSYYSGYYERMVFDSITPCSSTLNIVEKVKTNNIDFLLFPNPCTNQIGYKISGNEISEFSTTIFDLKGREILTIKDGNKENKIELTNIPPGTYIIRFTNDKGLLGAFKFIKQ